MPATLSKSNMLTGRPSPPCKKDCPNRSPSCHGQCDAYIAYEKERNAIYEQRAKQRETDAVSAYHERMIRYNIKQKMRNPKWLG